MTILIIEDEVQTAIDLQRSIEGLRPDYTVLDIVDSVEAGLEWFDNNPPPDLIFSDIQLGDGLVFDLLKKISINCPLIFCTAYDQYAIRAFQNNGIDYLLKPVEEEFLKRSLDKAESFIKPLKSPLTGELLNYLRHEISGLGKSYKSTFLVSYREKLIPVATADIRFFRINNDVVELYTNENLQYRITDSLDYIESVLDPKLFFRANRQYLVAFKAIKEVEIYFDRKLLIHLFQPGTETIIVSKGKSPEFLKWMENR